MEDSRFILIVKKVVLSSKLGHGNILIVIKKIDKGKGINENSNM